MTNSHHELLSRFRNSGPAEIVPRPRDLGDHLDHRISVVGNTAFAEFAYLQKVAAEVWGAEETAHFSRVLRDARVTPKAARKANWAHVMEMIDHLPNPWRAPMMLRAERSRKKNQKPGQVIWSADHASAIISALCRWAAYATGTGQPLVPGGAALDLYGTSLIDPTRAGGPVTLRTASDYISRLHAGLAVVAPDAPTGARAFVVRDWRERAALSDASTKTGAQLVGAATLYALGFDLIEAAGSRSVRGLHAAKDFRNGLILAIGTALPQRARALSALAFGSTLWLLDARTIHVRIPAHMLKLPEAAKDGPPFDVVFRNDRLAAALTEYRCSYRPLFDDGSCLFPSMHATGQTITEGQIGRLAGDITKRRLGVRISIHRIRDNVMTDASEYLGGGRMAGKALLGHADIVSGDPYDHSDGMRATRDFAEFVDEQRTAPTELAL